LNTLHKSGASSSGQPPAPRNIESDTADVFSALVTLLPNDLMVESPTVPNGPTARNSLLTRSLEFQASLVVDIVHARNFSDKTIWDRCVAAYAGPWFGREDGLKFAETVRSHFLAIDQVFILIFPHTRINY
jgi:elongation factor 3